VGYEMRDGMEELLRDFEMILDVRARERRRKFKVIDGGRLTLGPSR
jgi:hypothetical protein